MFATKDIQQGNLLRLTINHESYIIAAAVLQIHPHFSPIREQLMLTIETAMRVPADVLDDLQSTDSPKDNQIKDEEQRERLAMEKAKRLAEEKQRNKEAKKVAEENEKHPTTAATPKAETPKDEPHDFFQPWAEQGNTAAAMHCHGMPLMLDDGFVVYGHFHLRLAVIIA